jgi:cytochrome P450
MLAKYPEVERKVREEMREVIGDSLDNLDFEVLKRLTYLEKVQKETLRMYSPAAGIFLRQAVKDHYIGNIPVQKGMIVAIKMNPNHFKEEFYERPEVFDPDRWTKIDKSKVDPLSYFPFSSGQRNCIGQHLSLLESKIAVVSLLHRYTNIGL